MSKPTTRERAQVQELLAKHEPSDLALMLVQARWQNLLLFMRDNPRARSIPEVRRACDEWGP